ncbi:MAG TPA: hypothetical protein VGH34_20650 [Vicinamibacterales bacterium]
MGPRPYRLTHCSAVILAAFWFAGSHPSAQMPAPPAASSKTYVPPRTADGHPDLQGNYDAATMTPIERPALYGNRLLLTSEEAYAIEHYEEKRMAAGSAPSAADRSLPPVGGDHSPTPSYLEQVFRGGGGVVGGYNTFWISPGTSLATINGEKRTSIVIDPPNGLVPPVKSEARQRNQAILATRVSPDAAEGGGNTPPGQYDDPEARPLAERCLLGFSSTSGPPTLPNYWYNNLKQIVQTRDTVMILNEMVHDVRIIRMNAEHLPSNVRKWMGDSVGHWDGDTLVIDTTNFTDKTQFRGSSENLHVVERISRMNDRSLLYHFTVADPNTWDRPWTGEYSWTATSDQIFEYACHEANYALENVLRGARTAEKEATDREKGRR